MNLQKKIIVMFLLFAVVIAGVVAVIDYGFVTHSFHMQERERLELDVEQYAAQFETIYHEMSNVPLLLLSEIDIRDAVRDLVMLEERVDNKTSVSLNVRKDLSIIGSGLNMDYLHRNFARVIFFTNSGFVKASNDVMGHRVDVSVNADDLAWLDPSMEWGSQQLVQVHQDDWSEVPNEVVSLVKRLGYSAGAYLEVQKSVQDLDEIFGIEKNVEDLFFYDIYGNLIYSNVREKEAPILEELIQDEKKLLRNRIVMAVGKESGVTLVLQSHDNISGTAAGAMLPMLLVSVLTLILFSFFYSRFSAENISRPIRNLQTYIEQTDLNNLENVSANEQSFQVSEVMSLYHSYRDMELRLYNSMQKEKQLSSLQLQAQFDLLQAQVNPHFLYNVLNVISYKGVLAGDESISNICVALGNMLRYSTDTREKTATVSEEIQYLDTYFRLLKERYEHRLEYQIRVEDDILEYKLPKIVFQQIAENSINHGYTDGFRQIRLDVEGKQEDREWYVNIRDNGQGCEEKVIRSIQRECAELARKLSEKREHVELQIGGMGLVNTFARLYLVYGRDLIFKITSDENGTCVKVGAKRG